MLWLSFQAGLTGWRVHAAPLVLVTGAFWIADSYSRGDWPEVMAAAALPLLLASTLSLLRSKELKAGPAIAFIVATLIFTGSHNLALLWGTLEIVALVLVGVATVPSLRRPGVRRIAIVCGLGTLAIGLNAWFLAPDVAYSHATAAAAHNGDWDLYAKQSDAFDDFGNVFALTRHSPAKIRDNGLALQLPTLVLLWALIAGALSIGVVKRTRAAAVAAGVAVVIAILTLLLLLHWPWQHAPGIITALQFTFRLEAYILVALGIVVALLLRAMQDWEGRSDALKRWMVGALAVVLGIGFVQATWQAWDTPSLATKKPSGVRSTATRAEAHRDPTVVPSTWYAADFRDHSSPLQPFNPTVIFPAKAVKGDRLDAVIPPQKNGAAVGVNVAGGPYLVRVVGARNVGRTYDGSQVVLPPTSGATKVRVEPQQSLPVRLGRWVSVISCVALVTLLLMFAQRSLNKRRRKA
jgi:hypothetical protein